MKALLGTEVLYVVETYGNVIELETAEGDRMIVLLSDARLTIDPTDDEVQMAEVSAESAKMVAEGDE